MGKQKTAVFIPVVAYLLAIVMANLIVTNIGPSISIVTAFFFIGFDITMRDYLHDLWSNEYLKTKMGLLILTGSTLSFLINSNSANIAIASFCAFAVSSTVDTVVYMVMKKQARNKRVTLSNVFSSAADSFIFPVLAFGLPVLWPIVLGQFIAKITGGAFWLLLINMALRRFNRLN